MKITLLTILIMILSCKCYSNDKNVFIGDNKLTIDVSRGKLSDGGDLEWDVRACSVSSGYVCLMTKIYPLTIALPIEKKLGKNWYFQGKYYEIVMDLGGGKWLVTSQFSEPTKNMFEGSDLESIVLYEVKNNSYLGLTVLKNENGIFTKIRSWRYSGSEGLDLKNLEKTLKNSNVLNKTEIDQYFSPVWKE